MKRLLTLVTLVFGGLFFAQNINAQRHDNGRHRGDWQRYERRENRDWDRRDYNRLYVVNEYRYVRYGRMVYKETYRSTYTRNGMLVSRVLVDRERVGRYDDRDRNRFRFNIFLRF